MDVMLAGKMSGLEAANLILRELASSLRFWAFRKKKKNSLSPGVRYLKKPFTQEELAAAIAMVVGEKTPRST